jgi:hypothetical protein
MRRYNLTLTENQCRVLIDAMDLYQRIGMGQLDEIRRVAVSAPGHVEDMKAVDATMAILKFQLLGWPHIGTSHSILSKALPDAFRVAWDIHQVIRHRLAHDGLKPGENPGIYVKFDKPLRSSQEELPGVEEAK